MLPRTAEWVSDAVPWACRPGGDPIVRVGGVSAFRTGEVCRLTASGPPAILGRMTNSQLVIV